MKYFAKISASHWTLKNKVNKLAREYAESIDATLLHSEEARKSFQVQFKSKITHINNKNPRSKDLSLHIWKPDEYGDIIISISGNFIMYLHKVKHGD